MAKIRTMFPWWSCGFCLLSIQIRPNFDTKHLVSTFYTYSPLLWEARGPGGLNTIHHLSLALSSVKEKFFCRLSQSSLHFPLVEAKFFFSSKLFSLLSPAIPGTAAAHSAQKNVPHYCVVGIRNSWKKILQKLT